MGEGDGRMGATGAQSLERASVPCVNKTPGEIIELGAHDMDCAKQTA